MARTAVALYDDPRKARDVVQELVDLGIPRDNISLIARDAEGEVRRAEGGEDVSEGAAAGAGIGAVIGGVGGLLAGLGALVIPGIGPVVAAGPIVGTLVGAGAGAVTGGVIGALVDLGMPEQEAEYFAEGVRRGGTLVAVETSDDMIDQAVAVMRRHNPVDIKRRAEWWRERGWEGFDEEAEPYRTDIDEDYEFEEGKAEVPLVEEELQVGKREVEHGGVRVHRYVRERPVEEQVRLREEDVDVTRRRVDRPARDEELDEAFREETIEVSETDEEPVVAKRARVTEEVVIDKDVSERTETVRDTVRYTDVDVEQIGTARTERMEGMRDFEAYEPDFRRHFTRTYADTGYTYDQYVPAYRYGYNVARDERYRDRGWREIEPEVQRRWEQENPGTWEQVKDAVRDAWQSVKAQF